MIFIIGQTLKIYKYLNYLNYLSGVRTKDNVWIFFIIILKIYSSHNYLFLFTNQQYIIYYKKN